MYNILCLVPRDANENGFIMFSFNMKNMKNMKKKKIKCN